LREWISIPALARRHRAETDATLTTSSLRRVTRSRNNPIGSRHRIDLHAIESSSICATCQKFGVYPACPYRSQVVYGGTPCGLIMQADENGRDFHKSFKEQQHQRQKPGS